MNAAEIIQETYAKGIRLSAVGERLRVDAPAGVLDPELRDLLKEHKQEVLSILVSSKNPSFSPDWNQTPDPSATRVPFNQKNLDDIKAGRPAQVWSAVLEDWLWWVRDEDVRQALLQQGCEVAIYTLGELAVVAGWEAEALRDVHAFKREMGATIEPPVCGDSGQE